MKHAPSDNSRFAQETRELREIMQKFLELTDQKGEGEYALIAQHVQGLSSHQKEHSKDAHAIKQIEDVRKFIPYIDDVISTLQREHEMSERGHAASTRLFHQQIGKFQLNINRFIVEMVVEFTKKTVVHRLSNPASSAKFSQNKH